MSLTTLFFSKFPSIAQNLYADRFEYVADAFKTRREKLKLIISSYSYRHYLVSVSQKQTLHCSHYLCSLHQQYKDGIIILNSKMRKTERLFGQAIGFLLLHGAPPEVSSDHKRRKKYRLPVSLPLTHKESERIPMALFLDTADWLCFLFNTVILISFSFLYLFPKSMLPFQSQRSKVCVTRKINKKSYHFSPG